MAHDNSASTGSLSGLFRVSKSPWGPQDQKGALNYLTPQSQAAVMSRVDGSRVYDLSVDYFVGMPSFQAAGDPAYQIFMSHTPAGTAVDNLNGQGRAVNACCGYSGDVILMYTHTGTHIDSLNHFGVGNKIFNQYYSEEHLGSRGWTKNGAEQIPPIVARGVLLDVARMKGVECLAPSYEITLADCEACEAESDAQITEGDVVLIRTGRMQYWPDAARVFGNSPGITLEAAKWLSAKRIAVVGADNEAVEFTPSTDPNMWLPVHHHFLAEAGVPQMECMNLEEMSRDGVTEFAFIGAPIRLHGATGAPMRPLAFPLKPSKPSKR